MIKIRVIIPDFIDETYKNKCANRSCDGCKFWKGITAEKNSCKFADNMEKRLEKAQKAY